MSDDRLFTRREGIELIRVELGVPIPLSRFEKDAMNGAAPRPAATYGRHFLYTRAQILGYGRSLIERTGEPSRESAAA